MTTYNPDHVESTSGTVNNPNNSLLIDASYADMTSPATIVLDYATLYTDISTVRVVWSADSSDFQMKLYVSSDGTNFTLVRWTKPQYTGTQDYTVHLDDARKNVRYVKVEAVTGFNWGHLDGVTLDNTTRTYSDSTYIYAKNATEYVSAEDHGNVAGFAGDACAAIDASNDKYGIVGTPASERLTLDFGAIYNVTSIGFNVSQGGSSDKSQHYISTGLSGWELLGSKNGTWVSGWIDYTVSREMQYAKIEAVDSLNGVYVTSVRIIGSSAPDVSLRGNIPPVPEENVAGVNRYAIYIGGKEYYPTNLNFEKDVSMSPCTFGATFPGLLKGITMGDKAEIYRDGNLAFKGNVEKVAKRANMNEVSTIVEGRDLKWKLLYQKTDRYMYSGSGGNSATGSGEPADIVKDVISGSTPDLRPGIIDTYGTAITYPCRNYTKEKILKELQLFTGWEIDITTEGLVHFRSKVGLDKSDKVKFIRGVNIV